MTPHSKRSEIDKILGKVMVKYPTTNHCQNWDWKTIPFLEPEALVKAAKLDRLYYSIWRWTSYFLTLQMIYEDAYIAAYWQVTTHRFMGWLDWTLIEEQPH